MNSVYFSPLLFFSIIFSVLTASIGIDRCGGTTDFPYLALVCHDEDGTLLSVSLDQEGMIVSNEKRIRVGKGPNAVIAHPNSELAFVSLSDDDAVAIVSVSSDGSLEKIDEIAVGEGPIGMALTPDGELLFVANLWSDSISVLSISRNSVEKVKDVSVGFTPINVASYPNGNYALVANFNDDTLSQLAISRTGDVSATGLVIPVENGPIGIDISPDGLLAFVTGSTLSENFIQIFHLNGDTIEDKREFVAVGDLPLSVRFTPDGSHALVANAEDDSISLLAIDNNQNVTVTQTVSVGNTPVEIAISSDGKYVLVANSLANTVESIKIENGLLKKTGSSLLTGSIPAGLTFVEQ